MTCPNCRHCDGTGRDPFNRRPCDWCDGSGLITDRSDDLFIPDDYLVPCETCCKVLPEGRERFCDDACAAKEASPDTAAVSFREQYQSAWAIKQSVR